MEPRSLGREVALLVLGQVSYESINISQDLSVEQMLDLGLDTLLNHWREQLDECSIQIESAQGELFKSELEDTQENTNSRIRQYLSNSLTKSEKILNTLSDTFELSKLLTLSDHDLVRKEAMTRVKLVIENFSVINTSLDNVMEGWRLKRLPRIDQDILRLAYVDLYKLNTPIPVTCNEAVNLANRYSDEQGRKMINGVLRRLQNTNSF